tara:strand:- start:52 stop:438 length:387 start_codon:yes stop_codon:yes gene_type:complete
MKLTERQLRRTIRKLLKENDEYKQMLQQSDQKSKVKLAARDYANIMIDQFENLISGIDVDIPDIEKRWVAFTEAKSVIGKHQSKIESQYNTEISDIELERSAAGAESRRGNRPISPKGWLEKGAFSEY